MNFLDFLSGGLTAATNAAGGYQQGRAQGEQTAMQNNTTLANLMRQREAEASDSALKDAQAKYFTAGSSYRDQEAQAQKVKTLTNQRAYGALRNEFAADPEAQSGYDDGTDYTGLLAEKRKLGLTTAQKTRDQQASRQTLMLEFPNNPVARAQLDPATPAPDYVAALADARDRRKIDASQSQQRWTSAGIDPTTGMPMLLDTRSGATKLGGGYKATGASGASGAGVQAPIGDMENQLAVIKQGAQDLNDNKWQLTPGMQAREGLTYGTAKDAAEGHPSMTKPLLGAGMDLLGTSGSPEDFKKYQELMTAFRAYGDDAAKAFRGRQNEAAVVREIATLQLTPDDYRNPTVVNRKVQRMSEILDMARTSNPGQGPGARAPTRSAPPAGSGGPLTYEQWKQQNGIP